MYKLLESFRILELTRLLPGPYATLLLADLGAEVIKIEEPPAGDPVRAVPPLYDDTSHLFHLVNRNKKSVALNLKSAAGRAIFLKLAQIADAVIEGFRPGVMTRLGVDYDAVRTVKPDIVYCSLTGYGQTGPYRQAPGHDLNYMAIAGALTGHDAPVIPNLPIADLAGGTLAAFYLVAALLKRARTGQGEYIDLALTDAALSWMTLHFAEFFSSPQNPRRGALPLGGGYPCYSLYKTCDGRFLSVACLEPQFWRSFCEKMGRLDLSARQFESALTGELRELFQTRTREEWLQLLAELPVAPVYEDLSAVLQDPQVQARGLFFAIEGVEQIASPGFLPKAPREPDRLAPKLGAQTPEILSSLGCSADEIARWREQGVIC